MMPLGGGSNSGLPETSCNVLLRDLRHSLGGGGGRLLEELKERTGSFSIGGGGVADVGESTTPNSGRRGKSGTISWAEWDELHV